MRHNKFAYRSLRNKIGETENHRYVADAILFFLVERSKTVDEFEGAFVHGQGGAADYFELRILGSDGMLADYIDEEYCDSRMREAILSAGSALVIAYTSFGDVPPVWTAVNKSEYQKILSDVLRKVIASHVLADRSDSKSLQKLLRRIAPNGMRFKAALKWWLRKNTAP